MFTGGQAINDTVTAWPTYDAYYGLFDLEYWRKNNFSLEVLDYVKANVHPLDIVFRLAEEHGIVLLNGGGFAAPNWSRAYRLPTSTTKPTPISVARSAPSPQATAVNTSQPSGRRGERPQGQGNSL
jgi:hypothetical protein